MDLRHFKYFLCIARLGSFTKASEELCVTQPTLSHQIRQLEGELGCELLDRSSRNVRLTSAGEIFSDFAKRALREAENAKSAIQEYQGLRTGSLTIGVISAFINNLLPPIVSKFLSTYPGIQLKVIELPTGEMERQVRDGDLAFGIGYGPAATEHIIGEELFREDLMLIVSKSHDLAKKPFVTFPDIADTRLALLSPEYISRRIIDLSFVEAMKRPEISVEMNSIDAILETVAHTQLATILTKRMAEHSKRLVAVPIHPIIARSVAIFTRDSVNLSPAGNILLDMIRVAYQQKYTSKPSLSKKIRVRTR